MPAQVVDDKVLAELRASVARVVEGVCDRARGLLDMAAHRARWLVETEGMTKEQAVRCAVCAILQIAFREATK